MINFKFSASEEYVRELQERIQELEHRAETLNNELKSERRLNKILQKKCNTLKAKNDKLNAEQFKTVGIG